MKRLSKFSSNALMSLITLIMGVSLAVPISVSAVAAPSDSRFCTSLSADVAKVNTPMASLKGKLSTVREDQDEKIVTDQAKIDKEIQANRDKWDAQRQTNFTKLEDKGKTDAQKAAIIAYQNAIKSAVSTRRAAYDAARSTFRKGVKDAVAARKTTADTQVSAFTSAVNAAIASAQASCAADSSAVGSQAIRATFLAALKTARQNFQSTRKDDATIGSQIKQLAQTRNDAFKAADAVFKTTTFAARTALKAAFGTDASSVD